MFLFGSLLLIVCCFIEQRLKKTAGCVLQAALSISTSSRALVNKLPRIMQELEREEYCLVKNILLRTRLVVGNRVFATTIQAVIKKAHYIRISGGACVQKILGCNFLSGNFLKEPAACN